MSEQFTTEDACRLLELADQFLEDWREEYDASDGRGDERITQREKEWRVYRPLFAAAPELLKELQHAQTIIRQLQHMLFRRGVDDKAEWPSLRELRRISIINKATRGLSSGTQN